MYIRWMVVGLVICAGNSNAKDSMETTRRVTTGIDAHGTSKVIADEQVPTQVPYPVWQSFQLQDLFYTQNQQSTATRHVDKPYQLALAQGAMRITKIRMPTKAEMTAELQKANLPVPQDWAAFNLHKTASVDYIYVLSGSITGVVANQQFKLNTGDFLAQVGPEHTWINDSDEPCYVLCIMIGTD